ncbi:O-antigen polymerase [Calothrix sp. NIES-4071]|nr:O-antigen polymerase [Calothrix sp. NIES-4071]BAZ62670.1 O-antigen polymerase [Calothrix sp. NIES-4105]
MFNITIFEKIFVIIGVLFFSGAFSELFPGAPITLLRYIVWGGATVLACLRWKDSLRVIKSDIFLVFLSIIAFVSFLWSDVFVSTMKDSREILQMTAFGLYIAARFTVKEQVETLGIAFFIGELMSLVAAVVMPTLAIHGSDHPGAWKGVFGYKNLLGAIMVVSSFTFLLLPTNGSQLQKIYKWTGLVFGIILMLLSTSKTSLVVTALLFLILFFYRYFRLASKTAIIFLDLVILVVGAALTVVLTNWTELLTALGRDPTLTGRTPMWGIAITRLMDRPLLGFGRGAFWAPGSSYALEAGQAVAPGFIPPHGHNGFIDLALDVGLIGIVLFAISFLIAYFRALKLAYATKAPYRMWYLAFLMFFFMNNMTESLMLFKTNIYWTLYITSALSLGKNGNG